MIELVEKEQLGKDAAMEVAQAIHISNPKHITSEIVEQFRVKINT